MSEVYDYDWSDLAFQSKKALTSLKPIFIGAPRELSVTRFTQLVKELLPQGNIVIGLAKEDYISGFQGQPQFRTLKFDKVAKILNRVNTSNSKHKIYTLSYFQRETDYILPKLKPQRVVFVRGSWLQAFHTTSTYYVMQQLGLPYELVSPFSDEAEAKAYAKTMSTKLQSHLSKIISTKKSLSELEIVELLPAVSAVSFDYNFQVGLILAKRQGSKYRIFNHAHNNVVPYETFAMHHGAMRETNYSPPNDLNHYDTVHAEVGVILKVARQKQSLKGATLFINVMPCPTCSRMLAQTDIRNVVYSLDHSDGYAVKLLESAGKTVRRVTS